MTNNSIYQDIQARTGGDIYIGVVGPVRTGKSTVAELLNTYKPVFDKQCEVENSYRD